MQDPRQTLRSAIIKAADEHKTRTGRRPRYLVMSFALVKLLISRQVARRMVLDNQSVIFDIAGDKHVIEIRIADQQLGSSFNYLCDNLDDLNNHIADLLILQS